jgi:RNA polymerase sigma-70 factor (ECF subfamily)
MGNKAPTTPLAAWGQSQVKATPARLYRDHRDDVYRLCLRFGGGQVAWAEDMTHEVFIKLLEKLPGLDAHDDLGGWVYRTTVNACLTRLKREGSIWGRVSHALRLQSAIRSDETPERKVAMRQELSEALAAVDALPAKQRVVFCMRQLDELPQKEIARTLSLSEGQVSKLLSKARERLSRAGWST